MEVEEAFVDVAKLEVKLLVASDVVEMMHPMISAVVHTFYSMDLLSATMMTLAAVSYVVIAGALKLDDHVQRPRLLLQTRPTQTNGVVNVEDFLLLNCSVVVMVNLCDEQTTVVTKHTEHLDLYD